MFDLGGVSSDGCFESYRSYSSEVESLGDLELEDFFHKSSDNLNASFIPQAPEEKDISPTASAL
jgi:hypothetical protein